MLPANFKLNFLYFKLHFQSYKFFKNLHYKSTFPKSSILKESTLQIYISEMISFKIFVKVHSKEGSICKY